MIMSKGGDKMVSKRLQVGKPAPVTNGMDSRMFAASDLSKYQKVRPKQSKRLALEFHNEEFLGGRGFLTMQRPKKKEPSPGERAEALFGSIGKDVDAMFKRDLDSGDYLSL